MHQTSAVDCRGTREIAAEPGEKAGQADRRKEVRLGNPDVGVRRAERRLGLRTSGRRSRREDGRPAGIAMTPISRCPGVRAIGAGGRPRSSEIRFSRSRSAARSAESRSRSARGAPGSIELEAVRTPPSSRFSKRSKSLLRLLACAGRSRAAYRAREAGSRRSATSPTRSTSTPRRACSLASSGPATPRAAAQAAEEIDLPRE